MSTLECYATYFPLHKQFFSKMFLQLIGKSLLMSKLGVIDFNCKISLPANLKMLETWKAHLYEILDGNASTSFVNNYSNFWVSMWSTQNTRRKWFQLGVSFQGFFTSSLAVSLKVGENYDPRQEPLPRRRFLGGSVVGGACSYSSWHHRYWI